MMETSIHTNNTSACESSTCEAIDTKSILVGFFIGMVLCSPCVWLTGRRSLRNIKTRLFERNNITIPDDDDLFHLLLNQNQPIPAQNQGRHSDCTLYKKNETDSLLEFGIYLDQESYSKLKGDDELGIGDSGGSETITDIFDTTNIVANKILLDERKPSEYLTPFVVDAMPVKLIETELKLTSPANRMNNDDDETHLNQSTNIEQALAIVSENVGETHLNQSTNIEQALAIVSENVGINNDRERSEINWDMVFQKCVDLVKPLEYYQFFIILFGTIGIENPGRIIDEAMANNPLNTRTLILKLLQRWREYTGSGNIEAYMESTFKDLGWNTFLEEFRNIMRNPPLIGANSFYPMDQHPPVFHKGTSSLSEDVFKFLKPHNLAYQQDAKVDTRVEQIIICNGVTRKTVRQETSEILHDKNQCVSGESVQIRKRKLNMPCGKSKVKKCLENIDCVKQIDASQNDHPRQNDKVIDFNSKHYYINTHKDRRRKLKRGRYLKNLKKYFQGSNNKGKEKQTNTHNELITSKNNKKERLSTCDPYPRRHLLLSYRGSRNPPLKHMPYTKTGNKRTQFTPSNTSLNTEKLNNNDRKERLSTSDQGPRGHTLLSYHDSRNPPLNQMTSSNRSALKVDSGFSSYPRNMYVYKGTNSWYVHTNSRKEYEDHSEDSSIEETVRQKGTGSCGEDTFSSSSSSIVEHIEKTLASKLYIDKDDYGVILNYIISRLTNSFQTKEQVLELKLDELKNKEKGYFLLSGNKILVFNEKDWNSLILYVENARSNISDSFQTDMVFITYDGIPLKDI